MLSYYQVGLISRAHTVRHIVCRSACFVKVNGNIFALSVFFQKLFEKPSVIFNILLRLSGICMILHIIHIICRTERKQFLCPLFVCTAVTHDSAEYGLRIVLFNRFPCGLNHIEIVFGKCIRLTANTRITETRCPILIVHINKLNISVVNINQTVCKIRKALNALFCPRGTVIVIKRAS